MSLSDAKVVLVSELDIFLLVPLVDRLPVTGRATRHHLSAADLVIGLQLVTLGGVKIAVLPLHVVDLGFGPDEFLRVSVAGKAPFHLERIFLIDSRHIVDLAVASRTSNALCNVNTMVEIGVLGQVVHPLPLDRLIIAEARPNRFQIRAVCPDLRVTIHTRLGRRHTCRGRRFDRRVAIAAIDAVVTDMVFVAELDRLLLFEITARQI